MNMTFDDIKVLRSLRERNDLEETLLALQVTRRCFCWDEAGRHQKDSLRLA